MRFAPVAVGLVLLGVLAGASPASAASCPTQTFLAFDHLAYVAVSVPSSVHLQPGSEVGGGTIDQATSANGCRRERLSARVLRAGPIDPRLAVLVAERPGRAFVIGARCAELAGPRYWDCLLRPLSFKGQQFTPASYPSHPPPQKTLTLGPPLGKADYQGHTVTVRRIEGVDPALAVGISEQPSTAFLTAGTCPYPGFSNIPEYDNLLRCLRGPVWFTFDPPGTEPGGTVVARSDRALSPAVAGASISLVQLPVVADFVPPHNGSLATVGRVADQVSLRVPNVQPGLYEAVVSCPACASSSGGGSTLYPAGSILVAPKQKPSLVLRIISYAIAIALVIALILMYRSRRWRRGTGSGLGSLLIGGKWLDSSPRGRSSSAAASARPPAQDGRARGASPPAIPAARVEPGVRRGRNGARRGRKRGGGSVRG